MRIKVGHVYSPGNVAVGEATGDGEITWTGPGAFAAEHVARVRQEESGLRGEALLRYMLEVMRDRHNWAAPDWDGPLSPQEYADLRSAGRTLTGEELRQLLGEYAANYGPDGMRIIAHNRA